MGGVALTRGAARTIAALNQMGYVEGKEAPDDGRRQLVG
jgi:DNA-binding MarR family transcriptional regulator